MLKAYKAEVINVKRYRDRWVIIVTIYPIINAEDKLENKQEIALKIKGLYI